MPGAANRVHDMTEFERTAKALRDLAEELADFRVAVCENVAAEHFMRDSDGRQLNESMFGWTGEGEQWWSLKGVPFLSPIYIGARYESEPFWCNRHGIFTRSANPALATVDSSRIERYSGRKAAIVVPIHLPFGRVAVVSFHPNDRKREDLSAEFAQYADRLEPLARGLIIAYVKAVEEPHSFPAAALLNQREVECLQWAAGGKTDSEIAQIIARSHPTIRFHVRRAMAKLDAVNRSQAVFKAAQLGYLAGAR